jgi:short-subunit dehydrogenase
MTITGNLFTLNLVGSNSGIGKITAHELSKKGARVIMLCRNVDAANNVKREITKDTGHQVDVKKLNLASLESVKECANTLLEEEDKIDILINNAGNST